MWGHLLVLTKYIVFLSTVIRDLGKRNKLKDARRFLLVEECVSHVPGVFWILGKDLTDLILSKLRLSNGVGISLYSYDCLIRGMLLKFFQSPVLINILISTWCPTVNYSPRNWVIHVQCFSAAYNLIAAVVVFLLWCVLCSSGMSSGKAKHRLLFPMLFLKIGHKQGVF